MQGELTSFHNCAAVADVQGLAHLCAEHFVAWALVTQPMCVAQNSNCASFTASLSSKFKEFKQPKCCCGCCCCCCHLISSCQEQLTQHV